MTKHPSTEDFFYPFDRVWIINLVDRPDRRREMKSQLDRIGANAEKVRFFDAHRPASPGEFPSLGARGCFESQLGVLREAIAADAESVLILEDDFDFTREGRMNAPKVFHQLRNADWHIFYGAHLLPHNNRAHLDRVSPNDPVLTASFVAFKGSALHALVDFLEGILCRPAGAPDFGPMHVDGAYTVFRELYPQYRTFAAFPSLGKQRRSRSDITPTGMILDRWAPTRGLALALRGAFNWLDRQ